jgi:hypothetical protein
MAILTAQNAAELRRILKESTGHDISIGEAYAIWHYLIKLLQLLWRIDTRPVPSVSATQLKLFDLYATAKKST